MHYLHFTLMRPKPVNRAFRPDFYYLTMIRRNNFIVISGGPDMGKTTLVNCLEQSGYTCVAEVGRKVIQEQMERGGEALPWGDRAAFAQKMFGHSVKDFDSAMTERPTFFDRGIIDTIGYLELCKFEGSGVYGERCAMPHVP
jgi:predicted ATPase